MKKCRKCKLTPEQVDFPVNKGFKDGLDTICKPCKREVSNARYAARSKEENYARHRRAMLKHEYGMTVEQYEKMFANQNGKCKICLDEHEVLHVDHCHDSLAVRGLLCMNCNRSLGMMKDNPKVLRRAADYLEHGVC